MYFRGLLLLKRRAVLLVWQCSKDNSFWHLLGLFHVNITDMVQDFLTSQPLPSIHTQFAGGSSCSCPPASKEQSEVSSVTVSDHNLSAKCTFNAANPLQREAVPSNNPPPNIDSFPALLFSMKICSTAIWLC